MKIILEDEKNGEIEVIIRGNIADSKVQNIITMLKSSSYASKIIVFDESKEVLITIGDVYYFIVNDRKVIAVTNNGEYVCKYALTEIYMLFKNQGISQIGKGLLVNVHHVKSLETEFCGNFTVKLDNGVKLTASRFYMKTFRKEIMEA